MAAGLLRLAAAAAAAVVLVGCGSAGDPMAELPEDSPTQPSVVHDVDDEAVGRGADVGTEDGGDPGEEIAADDVVARGEDVAAGDDVVAGGAENVGGGVVEDAGEGGVDPGVGGGAVDGGGSVVGGAVGDGSLVGGVDGAAGIGVDGDGDDGEAVVVGEPCGWLGPACLADEGVAPLDGGGRLWWREQSDWESWVGRVVDWCDDYEALAALHGDRWYPFGGSVDDVYSERLYSDLGRLSSDRWDEVIVCSEADVATPRWRCWGGGLAVLEAYLRGFEQPPASSEVLAWAESEGLECFDLSALRRRYSYVLVDGPMRPRASAEEAVEEYRRTVERATAGPGRWLGFLNSRERFAVESPRDAVVVLDETVSVIDGVVRGLVQNQSERLWARDVTVTATDPQGVVGVGRFRLAVQPGEPAPFEIEGWDGSDDPSVIGLEVSAELSPRIDLSRSLELRRNNYWVNEGQFLQLFPKQMAPLGIPEGEFDFVEVIIELQAPTAHPRLVEAALEQTVEDLEVYAAVFWGGTVFDVLELPPMTTVSSPGEPVEWVEVDGIGARLPNGRTVIAPSVGVADFPVFLIWAGSPSVDAQQPLDGP